jgi:hypothetical protein
MTHTKVGGNEEVSAAAIYTANVFTDVSDSPGTFAGVLSLLGTAHFTFVGRDTSVNPLGKASMGTTTILESTFVAPIAFTVSSSLDIFAVYSFNGGPFTAAPERLTSLEPVPEPATGALTMAILLGILGIAARRRRLA